MANNYNKNTIYNKYLVIGGLIIFGIIVAFPLWYNKGKNAPAPELILTQKAKAAKNCVKDTDYMKKEHMQLLDIWRTKVVRNGMRIYENENGKKYVMSLTNTCLDCHSNKTEFCDRCHNYASVTPYCWDCHIDNPKEKK